MGLRSHDPTEMHTVIRGNGVGVYGDAMILAELRASVAASDARI